MYLLLLGRTRTRVHQRSTPTRSALRAACIRLCSGREVVLLATAFVIHGFGGQLPPSTSPAMTGGAGRLALHGWRAGLDSPMVSLASGLRSPARAGAQFFALFPHG